MPSDSNATTATIITPAISTVAIPTFAQSSVDPTQVSLTITSIGKAVASLIMFLGMVGVVDPSIAGAAWGNFVASVVTAIPAGFAVYHTGQILWGVIRKVVVALFAKKVVATPVV